MFFFFIVWLVIVFLIILAVTRKTNRNRNNSSKTDASGPDELTGAPGKIDSKTLLKEITEHTCDPAPLEKLPDPSLDLETFLPGFAKGNGQCLKNLLLPMKDDTRAEIDVVLVTGHGVFVIETDTWVKEYSFVEESRRKFINPYHENSVHCDAVRTLLQGKCFIQNIVLISDPLIKNELSSSLTFSKKEFESFYEGLPDCILNETAIGEITEKLRPYQASEEELEAFRKEHQQ